MLPQDEGERKALVAELHKLKTDIFMDSVQRGTMPLRPGVKRLAGEKFAISVEVRSIAKLECTACSAARCGCDNA